MSEHREGETLSGSDSSWFGRLKAGDHAAAQRLWEKYFWRLLRLAQKKLQCLPRRAAEEDVASSAFDRTCRTTERDWFPDLLDWLRAGDPAALDLWKEYVQQLGGLARQKFEKLPRRTADEKAIAPSAYHSLCRVAERGRLPDLLDQHDLWHLLVIITARKIVHRRRREGGRNPKTSTDGDPDGADDEEAGIDQLLSRDPTSQFVAQLGQEYQWLLDHQEDDQLQMVAVWKAEGYTNAEIAAELGLVRRSIDRKLRVIRTLLEKELGSGCGFRLIRKEPHLTRVYWTRITLSLREKNHADTLRWLRTIVEKCHVEIQDLAGVPAYADFVKSPQHDEWQKWYAGRRQGNGQPQQQEPPGDTEVD
jgi:hypothetical protein